MFCKFFKKSFSLIPVILLLCSTAFASEVITLPNGNQMCSYPCEDDGPVIVLDDGRQVCPLQLPVSVEAYVFVVKLNSDGASFIQDVRPSDSETEQFAIPLDYQVTRDYVNDYGEIVGEYHLFATVRKDSWKSVGNINISSVEYVSINSRDGFNIGPVWQYQVQDGIVANVSKIGCGKTKLVETNVLASHIDGLAPTENSDNAFLIPLVRVFATEQMRSFEIGEGAIVGGIRNIGDLDNEYALFVNISENMDFLP